jgi:hypothetical protein
MSSPPGAPARQRKGQHRAGLPPVSGRGPGRAAHHGLPLVLLAIVLGLGSYVRLTDLDRGNFRDDELFQYFVAESLERGEGPRLPSGRSYRRGIDVTYMVRLSVRQLGPSHFAIRLPSALLGALTLFIFAGALWAMGGPWVAVWGTAILAIYPEAAAQSRQLRLYSYQMVFGLLAFYTGWRAVSTAGRREEPDRSALGRQWMWAAATIALLLMATRVQIVSLSILAGWGVCVLAAAVADSVARGRGAWRRSAPLQLAALGLMMLALALIARPGLLTELVARSQHAPRWAVFGERLDPLTYYAYLRYNFPVLLSFLPLIFLGAVLRRPRLGVYLLIWFAVPMALHSFALHWKEHRFVLLAMPALFAAAAICAAWGSGALVRGVQDIGARWGVPARVRRPTAYATMAVVVLALTVTTPAFMETRALARGDRSASMRWESAAAILRERPDLADVPIGVSYTLHALYYWPRVDFAVRINGLERRTYRTPDGEWHVEYNPMGSPEYKVGLPVLTTPEAIQEHFADAGAVLISFDINAVRVNNIEHTLYERLEGEAEELCRGRCEQMLLYHWRFDAPPPNGPAVPVGARATGAEIRGVERSDRAVPAGLQR